MLMLFGAVTGGCSTSRSHVIASEYERAALRGTSIALLPLSSELTPDREAEEDQQTAYFTGEGHKLFYRLFGLELQEVASAEIVDLGSNYRPAERPFEPRGLRMPSGDSLYIPMPDGAVAGPNRTADFALLIDELTFAPRSESTRSGQFGSTERTSNLYVTATCEYMLWDNRREQVAAYGTFESESRMLNPNSRTAYETLFEELALTIVRNSPVSLSSQFQNRVTAP